MIEKESKRERITKQFYEILPTLLTDQSEYDHFCTFYKDVNNRKINKFKELMPASISNTSKPSAITNGPRGSKKRIIPVGEIPQQSTKKSNKQNNKISR